MTWIKRKQAGVLPGEHIIEGEVGLNLALLVDQLHNRNLGNYEHFEGGNESLNLQNIQSRGWIRPWQRWWRRHCASRPFSSPSQTTPLWSWCSQVPRYEDRKRSVKAVQALMIKSALDWNVPKKTKIEPNDQNYTLLGCLWRWGWCPGQSGGMQIRCWNVDMHLNWLIINFMLYIYSIVRKPLMFKMEIHNWKSKWWKYLDDPNKVSSDFGQNFLMYLSKEGVMSRGGFYWETDK